MGCLGSKVSNSLDTSVSLLEECGSGRAYSLVEHLYHETLHRRDERSRPYQSGMLQNMSPLPYLVFKLMAIHC